MFRYNMKRFYFILILIGLSLCIQAQNTGARVSRGGDRNVRQQEAEKDNTGLPELSVRAQVMNEQQKQDMGNPRWIRNILREVDLTKEKNAPLYFPVKEMNGMRNLFTSLFYLLSEDKIKVYKYRVDDESFDDDNILSFVDMLINFDILYDSIMPNGLGPIHFAVNASDIPSREVNKLFVKEAWYFDQNNSVYDVKTLAICPLAQMTLSSGEEVIQGMFWVKYDDIRPYIKNTPIMTSNINNAKLYTMDDFFRRRMYDGDIIQTDNLMNLPIAMLFDTDEEVLAEQERIEIELKSFRDSLWLQPDTATVVLSKKETRKSSSVRGSSTASAPKEKAPKQPKAPPAAQATKTAPTRSIRR